MSYEEDKDDIWECMEQIGEALAEVHDFIVEQLDFDDMPVLSDAVDKIRAIMARG